ncbi:MULTISPECIES: AAA family ATPase [unclassified Oceanobacillus]|uniref:AAA family ATPase n=1 Tax=unclassified Oceanobacillus TaxID=2630292 RepID=UPI00300DCB32
MSISILPKNERKVAKETPRNFVIFGGTMHGKTYFADEFPNPLNMNTDGNAEMIETPSINIRNERNAKGEITKPASEILIQAITELEAGNHTFETIVIDVIDDVVTLFEQEIIEEHGVKNIGDIGWGKGHQTHEMMVRVLVMRLKELTMKTGMNVLYLSRVNVITENDVERYVPSLKLKWLNIVNGNSDYTILCRKVGKNYIRRVDSKRKNYTRDKVDDERIAKLLDTVSGAYDRSQKTSKKEQEAIIKEEEKQQEVERALKQQEREEALEGDKQEKTTEVKDTKEPEPKKPTPRTRKRRRVATE